MSDDDVDMSVCSDGEDSQKPPKRAKGAPGKSKSVCSDGEESQKPPKRGPRPRARTKKHVVSDAAASMSDAGVGAEEDDDTTTAQVRECLYALMIPLAF